MDPSEYEFYINPDGTVIVPPADLSIRFRANTLPPEDEVFVKRMNSIGINGREAVRLVSLWNEIRDAVSPLRTMTIYHVEAFLEPGEKRGGAAVFVQLREPTSSPGFRRQPQRKRWGRGGEGYYIVRQEAVNLTKALEDAGYVSFIEDRGLGKWDVGVYVSTPREAKDVTRFMEAYIRAEMPLRLEWFTMA